MGVELGFNQVEASLAELHGIASDKRIAFGGRLKQLLKQGLTDVKRRPGRGKAGSYSFADLMRFAVALDFIQAGLMPQMAAQLISDKWSWGVLIVSLSHCSMEGPVHPDSVDFWVIEPEALRSLTAEGDQPRFGSDWIRVVSPNELTKLLADPAASPSSGRRWRTLVINGHELTQRVISIVVAAGYATADELRDDLREAVNTATGND